MRFLFIFLFTITLVSCGNKAQQNKEKVEVVDSLTDAIHITNATCFDVQQVNPFIRLVHIKDPDKDSTQVYRLALVKEGAEESLIPQGYDIIRVPIKTAVCMTTFQLSSFIRLNALEHVSGITSTRYLFNEEVKQRLKDGRMVQIGIEGEFDSEVVIAANPDLILISPSKRGGYEALKEAHIPLIPHLGYKEMTPLGQAEWIKFVGLLIGKEKEATEIFHDVAKRYNEVKALVANVKHKPTVFSSDFRGGNCYVAGGKSYLAQLFNDAGATYFLQDDDRTSGFVMEFETLYAKAANVDYWRILNSYKGDFTYDVLKSLEQRYTDFSAFKNKKVIYCNMSLTPYYEHMAMQPEMILSDFVKIFHPEVLPNHQPVFYHLLQ
ncbi:MAG: ABC transporter substrate-binding protein [Phocaeicola sp.]|nr:ABC transporter substrate-binding protein [Phocaeicola sp.]MDD7448658.1 ABC transporter substrate-binding protein [Prevotellaceae bacterium]MDY5938161.1 ABC transporter substrate-binding protein [Phocaeicola sp.]